MMRAESVVPEVGQPTRRGLPSLQHIKRHIPILNVAAELGIHIERRGATWSTARCFRPENHKSGDRTPSLNFQTKKNKYMCFACDSILHSNIDLVMAVEGYSKVRQAVEWFEMHYPGIPREAVSNTSFDFRAGIDEFRTPDDLVRAGIVPHLTDSALKVFVVIAAFRDTNDRSQVSYDTIMLRSGIRSRSTVCKAIKNLEGLGIFETFKRRSRHRAGNETTQYSFTFDDPKLFAVLRRRDFSAAKHEAAPTIKPQQTRAHIT